MPVTPLDNQAQRKILTTAKELAEKGDIIISEGGGEEQLVYQPSNRSNNDLIRSDGTRLRCWTHPDICLVVSCRKHSYPVCRYLAVSLPLR